MIFGKFLDPKNDFAFKRIFGTEKNKDILIHFINDMLGFSGKNRIQNVSFLKTAQDPEIAAKKQSLIDVLCQDELGRQYIVEMQVARVQGFEKRAQYYAAKAYSRQLNQGEQYHELKEVIFLAITDFVMFPDKAAYKSDHVTLDQKTYSHDLKDFSFTFLELPKFTKTADKLETLIEKWAYFFKHAEDTHEQELNKIVGSDEVIQRAYEELNRFSWSDIELNTYEQEEKRERDAQAIIAQQLLDIEAAKAKYVQQGLQQGIQQGLQQGMQQGIQQGMQQGQIQLAKNLIQKGSSLEVISHAMQISVAELQALLAEQSTNH